MYRIDVSAEKLLFENLGVSEDHREKIVEIVGDTTGQPTHRLHLLGLKKL